VSLCATEVALKPRAERALPYGPEPHVRMGGGAGLKPRAERALPYGLELDG